jgi:hypothetical protein
MAICRNWVWTLKTRGRDRGGGEPPPRQPRPHGDSHHGPLPGEIPGKNQFLTGSRWPILPGLSGNRRQHHPLARRSTGYRHDCPRPR